jgi:hypothetical protein
LSYEFEVLAGSNPAIEVLICWFDLSPSRVLYIGCMGS